jgi:hypothetical protein
MQTTSVPGSLKHSSTTKPPKKSKAEPARFEDTAFAIVEHTER